MRIVKILAAALLLVLLSACEPKITEGTVVEKTYRPSWVHMQPYPAGKGVILVPIVMPEEWLVVIEEDGVKEDFSVSKEDFDGIVMGQRLKINDYKERKKK